MLLKHLLMLFFIVIILYKFINRKKKSVVNKNILITGAANGLGREIVIQVLNRISEEKSKQNNENRTILFLVDKDETGLEKIGSIVNNMIMFNYEIELHCFVCDLSKEKEVDDMLEQVKEKLNFKQLDILINNAGIMFGEKINNFSLEQFKKTFEINIFSQVRLVKYLLPSLISSKGSIVSINSIMSQLPSAYLSDYCSSKSANFMFYECLRQEVGNKIHILSVLPYAINTNLFGKGFVIDSSSSFLEKMRNFMFPLLDKTEVAEQIIFAIETKQSYLYIYQSLGCLVFIMRLFPVKLYDFCLSLGCTEQSMIKIKSRV